MKCKECIHAVVGKGELVRCEKGYFEGKPLKLMGYQRNMPCAGRVWESSCQ